MSQENVEIVQRVCAKWERGNLRAREGVEIFDPEIVLDSFMPDSSERVVVHGLEGVDGFLREWLAQWRDYRIVGEEFREVGKDKVFVAGHQAATGRQSGVAVEETIFSVWTFRGGKVVQLLFDRDRQKALEAAGLRE
jgi:ketosteroid isomerase-like protein